MKKLMVLAAVAAMAMGAKAALTINTEFTAATEYLYADVKVGEAYQGYTTAYFLQSSQFTAWQEAGSLASTLGNYGPSVVSTYPVNRTFNDDGWNVRMLHNDTPLHSGNLALTETGRDVRHGGTIDVVRYSPNDFVVMITDGETGYFQGTPDSVNLYVIEGNAFKVRFNDGGNFIGQTATAFGAVPEPTSGLLLLLGVAGLALKRKRA